MALVGVALTGCSKSSADTFTGAVLHEPYHAPTTELTDTDGQPFSLADSTDKRLTLVFFGYTHCPDECPTTMATLASALLQLDDADRHERPGRLRDHRPGPRHRPGDPALARPLRPVVRRASPARCRRSRRSPPTSASRSRKGRRLPSGGYDVTHGTQVLALDGKNTVPVVWTLGTTAPEFAHDIHQLLS